MKAARETLSTALRQHRHYDASLIQSLFAPVLSTLLREQRRALLVPVLRYCDVALNSPNIVLAPTSSSSTAAAASTTTTTTTTTSPTNNSSSTSMVTPSSFPLYPPPTSASSSTLASSSSSSAAFGLAATLMHSPFAFASASVLQQLSERALNTSIQERGSTDSTASVIPLVRRARSDGTRAALSRQSAFELGSRVSLHETSCDSVSLLHVMFSLLGAPRDEISADDVDEIKHQLSLLKMTDDQVGRGSLSTVYRIQMWGLFSPFSSLNDLMYFVFWPGDAWAVKTIPIETAMDERLVQAEVCTFFCISLLYIAHLASSP